MCWRWFAQGGISTTVMKWCALPYNYAFEHNYTTVDNEAYAVYVCALSSTHCSPISDQGTWSCLWNVVLSISRYFHWIAISIDSDAQIETVYRTSYLDLSHLVYLQCSITHTCTGSDSCSMGDDFSHGHYSEEGVEGTHECCLCSWLWWKVHRLRICGQHYQGTYGGKYRHILHEIGFRIVLKSEGGGDRGGEREERDERERSLC